MPSQRTGRLRQWSRCRPAARPVPLAASALRSDQGRGRGTGTRRHAATTTRPTAWPGMDQAVPAADAGRGARARSARRPHAWARPCRRWPIRTARDRAGKPRASPAKRPVPRQRRPGRTCTARGSGHAPRPCPRTPLAPRDQPGSPERTAHAARTGSSEHDRAGPGPGRTHITPARPAVARSAVTPGRASSCGAAPTLAPRPARDRA